MKNKMKMMKKLFALALVAAIVLSLGVTAMAQTEGTAADGKGSITISNAANGETYAVYKLFSATNSATKDEGGNSTSIAYTGIIPESLKAYFTADGAGNITATAAAKSGDDLSQNAIKALTEWAKGQTATASAKSDGTALTFAGLDYGYYVVTTTQGNTAISVDSTNPTAEVVDKNSTTPTGLQKDVDHDNVKIGDTVIYTVRFKTANYDGAGKDAKQIVSYTIQDTLPEFLSSVNVTSIYLDKDGKIAGDEGATTNDQTPLTTQQFEGKKITIPWVQGEKNLYENGTWVVITYTAVVTEAAAIDGEGNTNTVTMTWKDRGDNSDHGDGSASETIYTYAFALKKVNEKGESLAGATFELPFYVKETPATDGAYIYAGTNSGTGLTKTVTTPATGEIVVKGLAAEAKITISETSAPNGYNKLTKAVEVTPVKTGKTKTDKTWKLDANGEVVADTVTENVTTVTYTNNNLAATPVIVVNKSGTELPSTGGIGTKIFYGVGAVLVIGAGVVLMGRKRAAD
jgi:LPXTG-motif cell wall-anchored protein